MENSATKKKKMKYSDRDLTLKTVFRLTLNCQFLNKRFGLLTAHCTDINILVFGGTVAIRELLLPTLNLLLGVSTQEIKKK